MNGDIENILKEINDNIKAIKKILEVYTSETTRKIIEEIATSPQRKQMWILCDGNTSTEEIGKKIHVSTRAVHYFVKDGIEKGLILVKKRSFPRRTIDLIPSDWKEFEEKNRGDKK